MVCHGSRGRGHGNGCDCNGGEVMNLALVPLFRVVNVDLDHLVCGVGCYYTRYLCISMGLVQTFDKGQIEKGEYHEELQLQLRAGHILLSKLGRDVAC